VGLGSWSEGLAAAVWAAKTLDSGVAALAAARLGLIGKPAERMCACAMAHRRRPGRAQNGERECLSCCPCNASPMTSTDPEARTLRLLAWPDLSPSQQAQVRNLAVSEDGVEFAGAGDKQVAAVEAESGDDLVGLAIITGERAVGFLVLKQCSKAPAWARPGDAVVSGMRIDQLVQGTGIGSGALALLPQWLRQHWPACAAIALTVDEKNLRGIKAYARAGFEDQGQRETGRIGWVRRMRLPVSGAD
jgi:RimJ/RimL family protein N-acetyltransferase